MNIFLRLAAGCALLVLAGFCLAGGRASIAASENSYVGAQACADCHPAQAKSWAGSHHAKSMAPATPTNVLGDFSGADPRFFRRGDDFIVRADGADGKPANFRVAATFGVAPLQQYLLEFEGGRLQAFPVAWDSRAKSDGGQNWFSLYPGEKILAGDPLHWTGRNANWNFMCAECHSTGVAKNYRFDTDSFDTRWREENVACEACHGFGARHVAWAKNGAHGADNGLLHLKEAAGFWGDFDARGIRHWQGEARKNPSEEICAPCHSRRRPIAESKPGAAFLDAFSPALLDPGLYFPDGQIKDEVFEWGSFQQSRMHAAGVTCADCHEPHGANLRAQGNALCGQCHAESVFDQPQHHHHEKGALGAKCVACHMPQRTYMQVHVRHDHSLRIPRPEASARVGAPNACNGCHADKSADWAAQKLRDWGAKRQNEAQVSDIAQATRLAALAQKPGGAALQSLVPALRSPSPLLRLGALRGLAPYDESFREKLAGALRDDPLRAIRIEAARLTPNTQSPALDEWRAAENLAADRPESHLNLGALAAERGDAAEAEAAFRRAVKLDDKFASGWLNLADLLRATGRDAEAETFFRKALAAAPDDADAHYAMALWFVRQNRLSDARAEAREAGRLNPADKRFADLLRLLP
jgi:predicted CXXCH cytochrome family protein